MGFLFYIAVWGWIDMVKFKTLIKENWHQPNTSYTFLHNVFLRHPDDEGKKAEWIHKFDHPENIFHVNEQWNIYWPATDLSNGYVCLSKNNVKRMVIMKDLDDNISHGNILVKTQEESTNLKFTTK